MKLVFALVLLLGPVPVLAAPAQDIAHSPATPVLGQNPALAGHYYLSGVMETGSELLLKQDGTFEWFISYGALDQFANGRWSSDGKTITLEATKTDRSRPLFAFRDAQPWTAEMEQYLVAAQESSANAAARERCSIVTDLPVMQVEPAVAPAVGPQDAPADANPSVDTPPDPSADPQGCVVPDPQDVDDLPPEKWTRGIAIRVSDEKYEQTAKDVHVTLFLADGTRENLKTDRRGVAIRPGIAGQPVVRVALGADYATGRDETINVPATTSGVLSFSIDIAQLVPSPFTTLRLRIDGRDLVPEGLGGRYTLPR